MGFGFFAAGVVMLLGIQMTRLIIGEPLGDLGSIHATLLAVAVMVMGIGIRVFTPPSP